MIEHLNVQPGQTVYCCGPTNGPIKNFIASADEPENIVELSPDWDVVAVAPEGAGYKTHVFVEGELVDANYDPLDELVSLSQLNQIWYQLEQAPIDVFGHSFDCRAEPDEKRMQESIEFWDQGPVPYWKTADNQQYTLADKQALINLYDEMRRLRRVRGQVLFNQVQTFKANLPNVTRRDLLNAGWIDA